MLKLAVNCRGGKLIHAAVSGIDREPDQRTEYDIAPYPAAHTMRRSEIVGLISGQGDPHDVIVSASTVTPAPLGTLEIPTS